MEPSVQIGRGKVSAGYLRCEYLENPVGIDVIEPRLSWQVSGEGRGLAQTAYQIQAGRSAEALETGENLLWDSDKVASDASAHIRYQGTALGSGQRACWRVRLWDQDGLESAWSSLAFWQMGLLSPSDWRAKWIEPDWEEDPKTQHPCPYLRKSFQLRSKVQKAQVYITSHGLYELTLNGKPVTEDIFTPGYTAYKKRLQYQVYDVSLLLQEGENAAGVILGDGWWRGKVGVASIRNTSGTSLALLMQMHIVYEDGSEQWVFSDESWKASTGPILMSDLKDGEAYDARLEMPGWDSPGFDERAWRGVKVMDYGVANLAACCGVPVRRKEEFIPVKVWRTPNGETVVDMGQNFAGRVRLKVNGPAGTTITLWHGEALDKAGNFTMKNLEMANARLLQKVSYTLKGDGDEIYEPRFTFHGFRYVKVEGFPGEPAPENFTGVAIYSDMPPTGSFTCSNELINQLQSNIAWSQKSNFLDIPTDCPQRERAGWTGDAQIFARTGSFIMDTAAFFTKWLKDLAAEQYPNGLVTNLVPNSFEKAGGLYARLEGSAGWGDAAVIIPWTMYLCYADTGILAQQYPSMKAWVDYAAGIAANVHWARRLEPSFWLSAARRERQAFIWDIGYHWGEWLEPDLPYSTVASGVIKRIIFSEPGVATPYLAYSSRLLASAARLLGKDDDAQKYQELSDKVKAAYVAEFVRPNGRIKPDRQASYVRALAFELLPDDLRAQAVKRLVELVQQNGNHLGTGFLSTPFLCHMLSQHGYLDLAYALLNQKSMPSWLYAVTKGATSIWETWDGIKEDGTPSASLNHYSYGAVGSWLYQVVAGLELDPQKPGYQHFTVHPHPGGGLTHARVTYNSLRGSIEAGWRMESGKIIVEVTVPANTHAAVRLPGAAACYVMESGIPLEEAPDLGNVHMVEGDMVCEVGSGRYSFEY